MSTLKARDGIFLEQFLEMESGYLCDFSDRTFANFVLESVNVDVYTPEYTAQGTSKAKRLRTFWKMESNYRTAKLLRDMLDYWRTRKEVNGVGTPFNEPLYSKCMAVVASLDREGPVEDISAFSENSGDTTFEHLADAIQKSIEDNKPEVALDRLHTYVVKYMRERCDAHSVAYDRDIPLHSLFGGYLKALRAKNAIESDMAERIMKSTIGVLESFNDVRNNQSLAHDNPLLNYNESMLIFRHVSNVIRFIETTEKTLRLT